MPKELIACLRIAVQRAIEDVGLENFKKTSMFMSNQRCDNEIKRAA